MQFEHDTMCTQTRRNFMQLSSNFVIRTLLPPSVTIKVDGTNRHRSSKLVACWIQKESKGLFYPLQKTAFRDEIKLTNKLIVKLTFSLHDHQQSPRQRGRN